MSSSDLRLYGTAPDSIVDGPGLRYAIFVQGCSHGCPGCHNAESQPAEGGSLVSVYTLLHDIRANGLVHGVTFSGGEPFEQTEPLALLASELKSDRYNISYDIWIYTGYLYEDLIERARSEKAVAQLLDLCDVLVDGPFIEAKKSLMLDWRGSSNQRLIDLQATRVSGKVVLWSQEVPTFQKPASW